MSALVLAQEDWKQAVLDLRRELAEHRELPVDELADHDATLDAAVLAEVTARRRLDRTLWSSD